MGKITIEEGQVWGLRKYPEETIRIERVDADAGEIIVRIPGEPRLMDMGVQHLLENYRLLSSSKL